MTSGNNKLLIHRAALCNMVRRIALEAGELTLDYFDEAGFSDAQAKADGSPVTVADQKAEELIEAKLLEILPDVPIVGEEGIAGGRKVDLSAADYFWLVDPLDGTKEFVSGSGDYTVNIALIYKGVPVLGVVYAPAIGELYAGFTEENGSARALRWLEDTGTEKDIRVRRSPAEGLTIVSSRSHGSGSRLEKFLDHYKVAKLVRRGSSLKICAVAAGKADLYPRLGPTCEWDTAAGDAVLRAAGGAVRTLEGRVFTYGGTDPKFLNPEFVAAPLDFMLPCEMDEAS